MATARRRLDLPEDRPASLDEQGHHVALNPADVKGPYRNARNWVYWILIAILLVLPWIRIAGQQAVLFDIPARRFTMFGLTFWAHDLPLVFFVLAILTLGLTLMTAVLGRVWCGWACPQTVFIDRVYRFAERWIEGDSVKRMRLNNAPMSWSKVWKKTLKWGVFWFISTNIAHSFTAYFVGAERLGQMSLMNPADNWTPFLFVTILTGILMFDFGWFREQFCIVMCPYGRFQSVLMDDNSLAIMYDEGRGEPRKGTQSEGSEHGDCVNCYRCVAVCPTGVDIRRGVQMECVACTACIDACDEIMVKVDRPKGLIRYASEESMRGGRTRWLTARNAIYAAVLAVCVIGLTASVARRSPIDVKLIRAVDTPYTQNTLSDGSVQIINHYRLRLKNQAGGPLEVSFTMNDERIESVAATLPAVIDAGQDEEHHVFFKFPRNMTAGAGRLEVEADIVAKGEGVDRVLTLPVKLVGPMGRANGNQ